MKKAKLGLAHGMWTIERTGDLVHWYLLGAHSSKRIRSAYAMSSSGVKRAYAEASPLPNLFSPLPSCNPIYWCTHGGIRSAGKFSLLKGPSKQSALLLYFNVLRVSTTTTPT